MDDFINKWSDFVYNHPDGNIFQTPEMYEIYQKTVNYEPIIVSIQNNKKNIIGILLAVIQKEGSGFIGKLSSRSVVWGGPLVKDNDPLILDKILQKYNKLVSSKVIFTQFRNINDLNHFKPIFKKNGFKFENHLDIINNLELSENKLWENLSRDRKKSIKLALKSLTIKDISNDKKMILETYKVIASIYDRIKLPIPHITFFYNIYDVLNKKNYFKTFAAYYNDKLIGVRIVLCYKDLIYDWYAGSDESYLKYRPNDILPWEIMKWGKQNGFKRFDFGGAGKPNKPYGVREYKKKFGGEVVNYGRFIKIHNYFLYIIGIFGLKIYKIGYGLRKQKRV